VFIAATEDSNDPTDRLAAEFAAVRREEREACAKVLESMIDHVEDDDYARGKNIGRDDCIAAIRAMNEKEGA
jgi:hypothetical protein